MTTEGKLHITTTLSASLTHTPIQRKHTLIHCHPRCDERFNTNGMCCILYKVQVCDTIQYTILYIVWNNIILFWNNIILFHTMYNIVYNITLFHTIYNIVYNITLFHTMYNIVYNIPLFHTIYIIFLIPPLSTQNSISGLCETRFSCSEKTLEQYKQYTVYRIPNSTPTPVYHCHTLLIHPGRLYSLCILLLLWFTTCAHLLLSHTFCAMTSFFRLFFCYSTITQVSLHNYVSFFLSLSIHFFETVSIFYVYLLETQCQIIPL